MAHVTTNPAGASVGRRPQEEGPTVADANKADAAASSLHEPLGRERTVVVRRSSSVVRRPSSVVGRLRSVETVHVDVGVDADVNVDAAQIFDAPSRAIVKGPAYCVMPAMPPVRRTQKVSTVLGSCRGAVGVSAPTGTRAS